MSTETPTPLIPWYRSTVCRTWLFIFIACAGIVFFVEFYFFPT